MKKARLTPSNKSKDKEMEESLQRRSEFGGYIQVMLFPFLQTFIHRNNKSLNQNLAIETLEPHNLE